MKNREIKHILHCTLTVVTVLLLLGFTSCYDDTGLQERVDELSSKVASLEQLTSEINSNISALQTALTALQNNDYITSIEEIKDGDKVIGYRLRFSKSGDVTIYHGNDGYIPVVGVKIFDDGLYYWTIDSDWLLDEAGNRIRANGLDGIDGVDGNPGIAGNDGITPQLKIDNGDWHLSVDNGISWTNLGRATGDKGIDGADGDSFFRDVTQDDNNLYLILANGTTITIPKQEPLSISFDEAGDISITAGATKTLHYTITGATDKTVLKVIYLNGWKAKVEPADRTSGTVTVTAPDPLVEDEIILLLYDGATKTIMSSINFITGTITVSSQIYSLPEEETTVDVNVDADIDYLVDIPESAESWISAESVQARSAMRSEKITFRIAQNSGPQRSAIITLRNNGGLELGRVFFIQLGNNSNSEKHRTISLTGPGTLSTLISTGELTAIDSLTIIGEMNQEDFETFRPYKNIFYLDISNVPIKTIEEGMVSELRNLKTLILPNSLEAIGDGAFTVCESLTSITLPDALTSIGDWAFSDCQNLTSITIPDGVTTIGKFAFSFCTSLTSITIPDGVTAIESNTFNFCENLTSITLSDALISIGDYAFYSCEGLTSITIPDGVTTIGKHAFCLCASLISITIPDGVTTIGDYSFNGCSNLTSITIPENVTAIGYSAFTGCSSLTSITLPDALKSIGDYAFYYCTGLTSITIPDGVTTIGKHAFSCCTSLTSIILPEGLTTLATAVFFECKSLTSVCLPAGLITVGYWAFSSCISLTSIIIPDNVTTIKTFAFEYCTGLTSVTISKSISMIEYDAFDGCNSIEEIYMRATNPPASNGDISNIDKIKLYIPTGRKDAYQSHSAWSGFKEYIEF